MGLAHEISRPPYCHCATCPTGAESRRRAQNLLSDPVERGNGGEAREKNIRVAGDRLQQVWFAGIHADVGGGYPDDGLSYVPLCWMIEEASKQGFAFEPAIVDEYHAFATPTGRIYNSRAGFGALWRYQPRDAQALLVKDIRPLVHGSVITRMVCGNDGYAPISLPQDIAVLPPYGPPFTSKSGGRASANRQANERSRRRARTCASSKNSVMFSPIRWRWRTPRRRPPGARTASSSSSIRCGGAA